MLAPIALVHILQHALTLTMRKVDVDVRRLATIFTEKTLEEQVHADRIDCRDTKAVADRGVGGRAATLTENAFATRVTHDVPHNQKISGHLHATDHRQFVRELFFLLRCAGVPPPLGGAGLDELCQIVVLADARRQRKLRQRRLELPDTELTTLGDHPRGAQTTLVAEPALVMQRGGLEIPLTVGTEARTHGVEWTTVTQCRERIVRGTALSRGVMRVVRHHPRHTDAARNGNQLTDECTFFGKAMIPDLDRKRLVEEIAQHAGDAIGFGNVTGGERLRNCAARTPAQCVEAGGVFRQQVKRHRWRTAIGHIHARAGDECTEVAIACA